MDLSDVSRLRLRNQRIAGGRLRSPEEVVGWLAAVQSQEYALARWSVGMRAVGRGGRPAVESEVERAIADGRILRTHVLRPTWHFILPRDIRPIMRLTAPRVRLHTARRNEQLGLDARQIARAFDLIVEALSGDRHMTRQELGQAIALGGVPVDGQRLAYIVIGAEMESLVASGAPHGAKQTYALLDERAPAAAAAPYDGDATLADLTRRYFTSHGPATIADFTWWSSLTVAAARRGLAANHSSLERIAVDGTDHWWAGDTAAGPDDRSPTVHLLQGFDEYVVGYRSPRTAITLNGLGPATALSSPSWLHGVFLDGQLIGWWRRVPVKEGFRVETKLFRELSTREQSALKAAVDRYSAFVE